MSGRSRLIWKKLIGGSAHYDGPAVFHITHPKAGSQWVYAVLREAQPRRLVPTQKQNKQVLGSNLRRGLIYPCVYLTRKAFEQLDVPADYRKFIVIRDLRDTLISLYFSLRFSHPLITNRHREARHILSELSIEDALLHMIDRYLEKSAAVQMSWMGEQELIIRYEELIVDEQGAFRKIFDHCGIDVPDEERHAAVAAHSFEKRAGRKRGVEDIHSHFRKGTTGDWRTHFTGPIKKAFKQQFNDVLVATGYELDDGW